jgi:hypothetical protein
MFTFPWHFNLSIEKSKARELQQKPPSKLDMMPTQIVSLPDKASSSPQDKSTDKQSKKPEAESPLDREQRSVAALLTRFKYLVDLAATPVEDGATKEVAAANAFRMEVESSALVFSSDLYPQTDVNVPYRFALPRNSFNWRGSSKKCGFLVHWEALEKERVKARWMKTRRELGKWSRLFSRRILAHLGYNRGTSVGFGFASKHFWRMVFRKILKPAYRRKQ